MVLFQILVIAMGILYGYLKPGKEDRKALLKKGLIIGVILAIFLIILGALLGGGGMILLGGVISVVVFVQVIIFTVLFIAGTFIGDWLEVQSKA